MQTTITEKDKKLLKFLAIFALIFGVGFGVIKPLIQKGQETAEALENEKNLQLEMEQKVLAINGMQTKQEELSSQVEAKISEYYRLMDSRSIDQMLTEDMLKRKILVKDMNIMMPQQGAFTSVKDYNVYLKDFLGQSSAQATDADTTSTYEGIYTAEVSLMLSGSKDKLQSVIDDYMALEPKVRVLSYTWSNEKTGEQEQEMDKKRSLSISMQFYMAEPLVEYMENYIMSNTSDNTSADTQDAASGDDAEAVLNE